MDEQIGICIVRTALGPDGCSGGGGDAGQPESANAASYSNMGSVYLYIRDYDRAIAYLDEAIRLDPKDVLAYNHRGIAYKNKGEYDRAIADYSEAIRLFPSYAEAYFDRGTIYAKERDDYDRAIADFNEVIRLNPNHALAYHNRGLSYSIKMGDMDKAIADFSEAIRLKPNYAVAYHSRSMAYREKGDVDRAIADCKEAIRLDPDNATKYREVLNMMKKSSGDCYIATAVYGSYDAPRVLTLRRFRDEVLASSSIGRWLIRAYYRVSPAIAENLRSARTLNGWVKAALDRFTDVLSKKYGDRAMDKNGEV
jgi:tetratricopeptide (TPR) repeat protein